MERAFFTLFFTFRSHQWYKKSVLKEKETDKRKRSGHLKKGKIRLFENLGAGAPSCKEQHADARRVIAYSRKTQSFMKNGGQQKCLDKALLIVKHEDVNIIIKKFHCGMISQNML